MGWDSYVRFEQKNGILEQGLCKDLILGSDLSRKMGIRKWGSQIWTEKSDFRAFWEERWGFWNRGLLQT